MATSNQRETVSITIIAREPRRLVAAIVFPASVILAGLINSLLIRAAEKILNGLRRLAGKKPL